MTNIADCLAVFSVAAMVNNPEASRRANSVIDRYMDLASTEPRAQIFALRDLSNRFLELSLDSKTALEIVGELDRRMQTLATALSSDLALAPSQS